MAFAPSAVTWSVFGPSSETTRMGRHWDGAGCGGLGCGGHSASRTGASQGRGQVPVRWGPLNGELGRVLSEDMPPQMHRVAWCLLGLCAV